MAKQKTYSWKGVIILFLVFGAIALIIWVYSSHLDNSQQPAQFYCGDGSCNNGETCSSCSVDCGKCAQDIPATQSQISSPINENGQPYLSAYCDKINPYDLNVREASSTAIQGNPGAYSISQILDIYDWVKSNIFYQNVPVSLDNSPYLPSETLQTKSGDCKNQAVLLASMIDSIGGTAKVALNSQCNHAYVLVYFTNVSDDFNNLVQTIGNRYNQYTTKINYYLISGGYWVVFDTAGGNYPGDILNECLKSNQIYSVSSCVTKVGNTIQSGLCQNGYVFGDDNLCHPSCGSPTAYCKTGTCYNNQCVSCSSGYYLATDGKCYPTQETQQNQYNQYVKSVIQSIMQAQQAQSNPCVSGFVFGSDNLCHTVCGSGYCNDGDYCFNGQCVICPAGTTLQSDGNCYPS